MRNSDLPIMPTIKRVGDVEISEGGLTKREYFAGLAMQGLLAKMGSQGIYKMTDAVIAADILLAELGKLAELEKNNA